MTSKVDRAHCVMVAAGWVLALSLLVALPMIAVLPGGSAWAQDEAQPPADEARTQAPEEEPLQPQAQTAEIAESGTAAAADPGDHPFPLEPHKLNYILPFTYEAAERAGREQVEVQYQISLKKRLMDDWPIYFGITQRAFWPLYDFKNSSPFRETNYQVELFYGELAPDAWRPEPGWRMGFEHESNGQGVELSRSWNRLNGEAATDWGPALVGLRLWYRFSSAKKTTTNPHGDDNPDIEKYMGNFEAWLRLPLGEGKFHAMMRKGSRDRTGTYQLDYLYQAPYLSEGVMFVFHYFYGYGESLIDYDRRIKKGGVGVAFQ